MASTTARAVSTQSSKSLIPPTKPKSKGEASHRRLSLLPELNRRKTVGCLTTKDVYSVKSSEGPKLEPDEHGRRLSYTPDMRKQKEQLIPF